MLHVYIDNRCTTLVCIALVWGHLNVQHLRCWKSLLRDWKTIAHLAQVRLSTEVRSMSLVINSRKRLNSSGPITFVIMSASCSG